MRGSASTLPVGPARAMLRLLRSDGQYRALRAFAQAAAALARDLGVLIEPRHDEERCRLVGRDGLQIDLHNPWHFTGCRADPDRAALQSLLLPTDLGTAGYLGRIDIVERLLREGADPRGLDPAGQTPIDRTITAWVTTDLHVACVDALLAAGAPVTRDHVHRLGNDAVGSSMDIKIVERLAAHTKDPDLREQLTGLIQIWRTL
jgi:hypothetical protein